jgi:hypothetical protein
MNKLSLRPCNSPYAAAVSLGLSRINLDSMTSLI